MRYGLETVNDEVLLLTGYSPLPGGAIYPVPNWDDIVGIKPGYLKVVGNSIVEKTQQEKDDWDEAHPPSLDELKEVAWDTLENTNYYVIRQAEIGVPAPGDVTAERVRQRVIWESEE